jgi:hypothetical protein
MTPINKTAEGERLVRERYLAILKYWPVANEHVRIATSRRDVCRRLRRRPAVVVSPAAHSHVAWILLPSRHASASTP